jgi:hypothetical protein
MTSAKNGASAMTRQTRCVSSDIKRKREAIKAGPVFRPRAFLKKTLREKKTFGILPVVGAKKHQTRPKTPKEKGRRNG